MSLIFFAKLKPLSGSPKQSSENLHKNFPDPPILSPAPSGTAPRQPPPIRKCRTLQSAPPPPPSARHPHRRPPISAIPSPASPPPCSPRFSPSLTGVSAASTTPRRSVGNAPSHTSLPLRSPTPNQASPAFRPPPFLPPLHRPLPLSSLRSPNLQSLISSTPPEHGNHAISHHEPQHFLPHSSEHSTRKPRTFHRTSTRDNKRIVYFRYVIFPIVYLIIEIHFQHNQTTHIETYI